MTFVFTDGPRRLVILNDERLGAHRELFLDVSKDVFTTGLAQQLPSVIIKIARSEIPPHIAGAGFLRARPQIKISAKIFDHVHSQAQDAAGRRAAEREYLRETLIHEIAHLWHNHVSPSIRQTARIAQRLQARLEKRHRKLRKDLLKNANHIMRFDELREAREALFYLFSTTHAEGLAVYAEQYSQQPFSKALEDKLYWKSAIVARQLRKAFLSLTLDGEFSEHIFTAPYVLGPHIVMTLLPDYSLLKIAKMSYLRFIREYAQRCQKRQPILSINDGGILDYNGILQHLRRHWHT